MCRGRFLVRSATSYFTIHHSMLGVIPEMWHSLDIGTDSGHSDLQGGIAAVRNIYDIVLQYGITM